MPLTISGDIKELLRKYLKLKEQNDYYCRYGRDPGEEAYDEQDRLYNEIRRYAISD